MNAQPSSTGCHTQLFWHYLLFICMHTEIKQISSTKEFKAARTDNQMNIYTLNVGQGQFVVVAGKSEAFIVDTYLPLNPKNDIVNIKAALAKILPGKNLIGLMVTGFDAFRYTQVTQPVRVHGRSACLEQRWRCPAYPARVF